MSIYDSNAIKLDESSGPPPGLELSVADVVKLGAVDSEFYARTFFPKTFRQKSPPFARRVWEPLEHPDARLVNLILFRGASKTTRLRTFASKRIAYGISRTILYIGASERDAIRSVLWLRGQVERNKFWRETFRLSPGAKWEETQIEIEHGTLGHTIWVLGAGINGSLRGINFDDYRPDLIVVDDPQTDETAATEIQREKVADLILGAVKNSLAPVTDEPNAKLVMAITPQHQQDVSQQALKDEQWVSRVVSCWTPETQDLSVEQQVSTWEERLPTAQLRADKRAAIKRNKLSIFSREMECKLRNPESAAFLPTWLNIRQGPAPRGHVAVLGIDPVPPPSERQMQKGLEGKDYETHYVWARVGGDYHLCECARNRGHDPSWSVATAFGLMRRWGCVRMVLDATAYQRTLKWIFEQAMQRQRIYYQVVPFVSKMKKFARIMGTLNGLATNGKLYVGAEHTHFIEQFEEYGPLYSGIDDDLDASAIALADLSSPFAEDEALGLLNGRNDLVEDFPFHGAAP